MQRGPGARAPAPWCTDIITPCRLFSCRWSSHFTALALRRPSGRAGPTVISLTSTRSDALTGSPPVCSAPDVGDTVTMVTDQVDQSAWHQEQPANGNEW